MFTIIKMDPLSLAPIGFSVNGSESRAMTSEPPCAGPELAGGEVGSAGAGSLVVTAGVGCGEQADRAVAASRIITTRIYNGFLIFSPLKVEGEISAPRVRGNFQGGVHFF
jgi:hypothetical protein